VSDRVLAHPADTRSNLLTHLRRTLEGRAFDASTMFIDPAETRRFPGRSVQLRLSVLLRTYRGEYPGDTFEFDRLAERIRRGDEHIWFWGAPDQIAAARTDLRRPDSTPVPDLALGTVTVLSAEDQFGPGHGELCRSGSMDRTVGAVAAIVHRMLGYHSGADRGVHDRFHTLLLTARNRASAPSVRGGEAVQHIHCAHVRSRYWGITPFYLMQGGVVECMELRESNRDPADLRRALTAGGPWWFADRDDAAFAEALTRLNTGEPVSVRTGGGTGPTDTRSTVTAPRDAKLVPTNHVIVRPAHADETGGSPFQDAVREAESLGGCTVVVHLPLDTPERTADQEWIARRGYTLTAISPPKRSWQVVAGTRRDTVTGPTGVWCAIRGDLPVAPPHYVDRTDLDADEMAVLEHLRRRLSALRVHA